MNGEQKQKRERLFLTQLREKHGNYGTYYIGSLQACDIVVQESAKTKGVWNVFLIQGDMERKNKPGAQGNNGQQNPEGWNSGGIPF